MKKTIFLTGSQGFIGKHLFVRLIELGYIVYCGGRDQLPTSGYVYNGKVINGFDYIIHLAAVTTTSPSFLPELFESNIVYAKQIMSIPTRIIYATSTSAAELTNPYAYTKRYIEHLGETCNSTGLRFFNCFGNGNNKGIIKKAIECAKSGDKMTVSGGLQIRDFIYIDDVVTAIIDALDSTEKIIEVGTGIGMTIEKALNTIGEIVGRKIDVDYIKSSPTDMLMSIAKPGIKGCLGFEDGIKRMLEL